MACKRSAVRSRLAPRFAFGYAWRGHARAESEACPAWPTWGEDGLEPRPDTTYHPHLRPRASDYVVRLHHPQHQFSRAGIHRRNRGFETAATRTHRRKVHAHRKIQTLEIGLVLRLSG